MHHWTRRQECSECLIIGTIVQDPLLFNCPFYMKLCRARVLHIGGFILFLNNTPVYWDSHLYVQVEYFTEIIELHCNIRLFLRVFFVFHNTATWLPEISHQQGWVLTIIQQQNPAGSPTEAVWSLLAY